MKFVPVYACGVRGMAGLGRACDVGLNVWCWPGPWAKNLALQGREPEADLKQKRRTFRVYWTLFHSVRRQRRGTKMSGSNSEMRFWNCAQLLVIACADEIVERRKPRLQACRPCAAIEQREVLAVRVIVSEQKVEDNGSSRRARSRTGALETSRNSAKHCLSDGPPSFDTCSRRRCPVLGKSPTGRAT